MNEVGVGQTIYDLKKKILALSDDLAQIKLSSLQIPELINSANLLRSNEYLNTVISKQSEIIFNHEKYAKELETMLNNIFEIQMELKDLLKMQTSMLSDGKTSKKKSSSKKKTKK